MDSDPAIYRRLGVTVTTEYAPPGKCFERRPLHSYVSSLDWIIPHLQAMGAGLERPDCELYVVGLRDITPEERATRVAAEEKVRAEELELLAALRAKYPEAP